EATDQQVDEVVATNLKGPIYVTRAAIPLLRARGGGDLIHISSEAVAMPFPYLGLYAASKGGLETFGLACAAELAPERVRVTTLVCGTTMSEFGASWDAEV